MTGKRGLSVVHITILKSKRRHSGAALFILYDMWLLLCCFCRSLSSCMARRYRGFNEEHC